MIRILLAEDHGMVQDALATLLRLEDDLEVVARSRYLLHGGPFHRESWQTPDTYHTAGLRLGTATSLQQTRGQAPANQNWWHGEGALKDSPYDGD